MTKKDSKKQPDFKKEIAELQLQLAESLEREKRTLADYKNMTKRNQEERVKFLQLANHSSELRLFCTQSYISFCGRCANLKYDWLQIIILNCVTRSQERACPSFG